MGSIIYRNCLYYNKTWQELRTYRDLTLALRKLEENQEARLPLRSQLPRLEESRNHTDSDQVPLLLERSENYRNPLIF